MERTLLINFPASLRDVRNWHQLGDVAISADGRFAPTGDIRNAHFDDCDGFGGAPNAILIGDAASLRTINEESAMMSAVDRIPDSSRTSRHVRKVLISEVTSVALFKHVGEARLRHIFYFMFLMDTEQHVAERIRIGGVGAGSRGRREAIP
jgi:hypothetical protein